MLDCDKLKDDENVEKNYRTLSPFLLVRGSGTLLLSLLFWRKLWKRVRERESRVLIYIHIYLNLMVDEGEVRECGVENITVVEDLVALPRN